MELWIKDTSTTPKEGWRYPAISGPDISTSSYGQLYGAVVKHYRVNEREVPTKEQVDRYICENLTVPCYEGREVFRNKHSHPPTYLKKGTAGPAWPLILMPLKLLAKEEDRGLGDIVARTVGPIGGEAWKKWHLRVFGRPCGCKERQEDWNLMYPL